MREQSPADDEGEVTDTEMAEPKDIDEGTLPEREERMEKVEGEKGDEEEKAGEDYEEEEVEEEEEPDSPLTPLPSDDPPQILIDGQDTMDTT